MKAKNTFLILVGLPSSATLAQPQMPPEMPTPPVPPAQMQPGPDMHPPLPPKMRPRPQPEPAPSSGASGPQTMPPPGQPAPMSGGLQPKTENGFTYLCGGVGADEAAQMKKAVSRHDLMLTFAVSSGAYLADVNVDIADARGKSMLKTTCDAPILLVDFPKSGTYRIRAETEGHALTRTVTVQHGKHSSVFFLWPAKEIEMGGEATLRSGRGENAGSGR